ncbi:DUF6902 family protein [Gemmobacter serpentinus]|uniref:DUF6902 family protein n=1 Tax=Gemmobacter serpentinus TaxID=2652247 RepID=UPI00124EFF9E|nr:hypothetical protein [Gemmobacter serpentinus]
MTNVVSFASRAQAARPVTHMRGLAPLLNAFAHERRLSGDAYWLKENAELLGILSALGRQLSQEELAIYQPFLDRAESMIKFYPQYYRTILGVVTALEELGHPGDFGARLADWIIAEGWIDAEVNDLQRGEVRHLLARHGRKLEVEGLDGRLMRFLSRPATFALPNPRAAYDLTHTIFYLADYGRRSFDLPDAALKSLLQLGCLAHLEQNGDLLAEVLLCLRFCGQPLPPLWLDHVRGEAKAFRIEAQPCADSSDAYHIFLVNQWLIGAIGENAFGEEHFGPTGYGPQTRNGPMSSTRPMSFRLARPVISPLREWSQALDRLGARRSTDWTRMRSLCAPYLSPQALAVADAGAEASPEFAGFFASFARVGGPAPFSPPQREMA